MKKLFSLLLCVVLVISSMVLSVSAIDESKKTIKKVVSIVYDDSGSMNNSNEDWAYASYSLQNLIGLMNPSDELSVVKMSAPYQTISFNLGTNEARKSDINSVAKWAARASTPFSAVQTAVDWLKTKKSEFSGSQSVEYWLVVLTDGSFETGYPKNMKKYLADLKESMGDSKYESIFVAIGKKVPASVKSDWISVAENHLISAANSADIVNAMSEVTGLILGQGGKKTNVSINLSNDGKTITFESAFPLRRFVVFEQNQSVGISSVSVDGASVKKTLDFSAKKPGKAGATARTIHCESSDTDYIPAGQIKVTFDSSVDASSSKLMILTESAVNIDIKVLDKSGNVIKSSDTSSLAEGDYVEFVASATSCIDGSPINLQNWANDIKAQMIVNGKVTDIKYNPADNAFSSSFQVQSGSNMAYAIVTLPGYFRAKSDVINIYPIEVIDNAVSKVSQSTITVPYKYCKDYEEIASFEYTVHGGEISGMCDFEFKNMPNGITASVNGIYANKDGKLSVKVHNDIPADVKFYRNRDYTETSQSKIQISVTSNQYVLKWSKGSITEICLIPHARKIEIEAEKLSGADNLKVNKFSGSTLYSVSVLADGKYLTAEELNVLKTVFEEAVGISYKTKILKSNGHDTLQVIGEKTLPAFLVKTGKITSKLTISTIYGESGEQSLAFVIKDSITKYILPIFILALVVFLLGYLPFIKKRFKTKKYHFTVDGEPEKISVKPVTRIFPWCKEQGYCGGLSLEATGNERFINIKNNFDEEQNLAVDGDLPDIVKGMFRLSAGDEFTVSDSSSKTIYIYTNTNDDDYDDLDSIDDDDDYSYTDDD